MKTQSNPALNAVFVLFSALFLIASVGSAANGQGASFLCLFALAVLVGSCVDAEALEPEWEQSYDIIESHPELVAPAERVHDHMLAWSPTHGAIELFHCTGSVHTYEGLDTFGNLLVVEDDVVVDYISATELRNPYAA